MEKIKRALISVSDKTDLDKICKCLERHKIQIFSTGGTAREIKKYTGNVKEISEYTSFPEMMDGRIKTLHPKIHGSLLALRDKPGHLKSMKKHEILPIDLVIINLYPFEEMVISGRNESECIENIDIGGPAMIRSASKNFKFVTVLTNVKDYSSFIKHIDENFGSTTIEFRKKMATKAFLKTANYDSKITNWMAKTHKTNSPENFLLTGRLVTQLRYGENPQQSGSLYSIPEKFGIVQARQIQGKDLSYNNINDADSALELMKEFNEKESAAVVIVKHANPCGVALGKNILDAYRKAFTCDKTSAFGGVVAVNKKIDLPFAKQISKIFTEVIVAPGINKNAKQFLKNKKNLRILIVANKKRIFQDFQVKTVSGGFLVQDLDAKLATKNALKIVTRKKILSKKVFENIIFAIKVCKHTKSNAIVIVSNLATIGIGAGQMSRIDSSNIAITKSKKIIKNLSKSNCVLASDAFFPFSDNVKLASKSGIKIIVQPGGSIKDNEIIKTANRLGITMIFTGLRHFKH